MAVARHIHQQDLPTVDIESRDQSRFAWLAGGPGQAFVVHERIQQRRFLSIASTIVSQEHYRFRTAYPNITSPQKRYLEVLSAF